MVILLTVHRLLPMHVMNIFSQCLAKYVINNKNRGKSGGDNNRNTPV